jgi:hypothetical protein
MTGRLGKHHASHGKEVGTKHLLLSLEREDARESRASLCAKDGMLREKWSAIAVVRILDGKRIASFLRYHFDVESG